MNLSELPEILTVKQVAEHMGWHPNTVYLRCNNGELKSFKSGNSRRIRKSEFMEWIAKLEREELSKRA